MTADTRAWDLLGIEPTSDVRAIKKAYARQLKAIDPEADPQAFVALREAFETAKIEAEWIDRPDEDAIQVVSLYGAPIAAAPARSAPQDDRWTSEPATPQDHAQALAALLYAHNREGPWATPEQRDTMLAHWHAIIGDPRMQEVAFYADSEQWFAETIARTSRFSDPLVIPAVDYFEWLRTDGSVHQARAVAYLTHRYRALKFLESIQQPGNRHYEAWCELTTPAGPGDARGRVLVRKIHRLLHQVRTEYPDFESRFDPGRLDLWDARRTAPEPEYHDTSREDAAWAKRRARNSALLIFAGILVLSLISQLGRWITPPGHHAKLPYTVSVPSPPLSGDPAVAIDASLRPQFGDALTSKLIQKRNPALGVAITNLWMRDRDLDLSQEAFASDLQSFLDDWYWNGVRNGGTGLLTVYQTLVLDMARAVRARDPGACLSFLRTRRRWTDEFKLPAEMQARDKAVMVRALLETNGAQFREIRVSVPGSVVTAAARRAHVDVSAIDRWLDEPNMRDRQCGISIAVLEAALATPGKQAAETLRIL